MSITPPALPHVNLEPLTHPVIIREESLTKIDRVALAVTRRIGTFGIFIAILGWSMVWLGWNALAREDLRFDPAPAFVLWLFISNLIQITLMPLMLISQNLEARHDAARSDAMWEYAVRNELLNDYIIERLYAQDITLASLAAVGQSTPLPD